MRSAEQVLAIIRERGKRGLPLEDVYRQLYNPDLYHHAYGKIARNRGALTPGVTGETADGMSQRTIAAIIDRLRFERYRWTPVKRVYIDKKGTTKKRPLGIPTWPDKLLQEVLRGILAAYYEPQFSAHSHGFRPGRGCHTALREVQQTWTGTVWFIEGDIAQCFDRLDHTVLLGILREKIHDNRFLRLLEGLLKAGYLEAWKYHATLSGTPQGGIVSPILANIYLDRFDQFVTGTLIPDYTKGDQRKRSTAYYNLSSLRRYHRRRGHTTQATALLRRMQSMSSVDPCDPDYRRLHYVRYADDFLLGFAGPRHEAAAIKQRIGAYLHDILNLALSDAKTLITHGQSTAARFLGYEVTVLHDDTKIGASRKRVINRKIGLKVPRDVVQEKCRTYMRGNKPIHLRQRTMDTVFTIVAGYQSEYRGIANYYQLAYNRSTRLDRLRRTMDRSLLATLANKLRVSTTAIRKKYRAAIVNDHGTFTGLEVRIVRDGKPPLVAQWGGVSLRRPKHLEQVILDDQPRPIFWQRTELVTRLLAETCELCGSKEQIEVHHIRALKDVQRKGKTAVPTWMKEMVGRQRKTLVVCHACHAAIHAGRPTRTESTGEPDEVKVSRPVRRGADGKVPP